MQIDREEVELGFVAFIVSIACYLFWSAVAWLFSHIYIGWN